MFFFVIKFQRTFTSRFLFLVLFLSFVLSKGIHSAPEPEICEFDQIEFALDSDLSNEVPKEPKTNLVFYQKRIHFLNWVLSKNQSGFDLTSNSIQDPDVF